MHFLIGANEMGELVVVVGHLENRSQYVGLADETENDGEPETDRESRQSVDRRRSRPPSRQAARLL